MKTPSAFPSPAAANSAYKFIDHDPGMTLLDYFASTAMQGIISGYVPGEESYIAERAYLMADAMMVERERKDRCKA